MNTYNAVHTTPASLLCEGSCAPTTGPPRYTLHAFTRVDRRAGGWPPAIALPTGHPVVYTCRTCGTERQWGIDIWTV
jgi:hypothetical protein